MSLDGKIVAITGASRGIGEAAARAFAARGAKVALLARSTAEIDRLAALIGPAALAIPCDVADRSAVNRAVDQTVERLGGLDILIGNAGMIDPMAQMADADPDQWSRTIDVNLKGVFYGMQAALPVMLSRGGGTILTVSSGAAHNPVDNWSAYCASKAGAYMLTRSLHKEYGARGIRALGLSPGTVATQMQREIKESGLGPVAKLDWSEHIPPEWAAEALVWMCGAEADGWLGDDVSLRDPDIRRKVGVA